MRKLRKINGKQRVAIVYPFPYLDSIPSLCNAATLLAGHGFAVDIFTRTSHHVEPPAFADERIRLFTHRDKARLLQRLTRPGPDAGKKGLAAAARRLLGRLSAAARRFPPARRLRFVLDAATAAQLSGDMLAVWRRHRQSRYRCFIGVDPAGLVQARRLSALVDAPLIYWSLELLLSHELQKKAERRLKRRETALSRKAAFIVIQDNERGKALADDNGLPPDKFIFVPNSPLGPVRHQRLNHWHRRLALPPHKRVVLHAGNLDGWTGISQIIASAAGWPEDWVLVVHTRFDAAQSPEIEQLQRQADPGRVFFSARPVSREEYDCLVDSADIGIAFYLPVAGSPSTQENIRTIGLSSGKIAYYLRSGLPVITNETTSLCQLVRQEGCGVAVPDERGIGGAIREIASHYESYRASAYRCFEKKLDFAGSFQRVIENIERL